MIRNILIIGLAIAVRALSAQAPTVEASERPFKLSVTAELVLLDVSVKSRRGEHVAGLAKSNFKVHEDGKLQTVSTSRARTSRSQRAWSSIRAEACE